MKNLLKWTRNLVLLPICIMGSYGFVEHGLLVETGTLILDISIYITHGGVLVAAIAILSYLMFLGITHIIQKLYDDGFEW